MTLSYSKISNDIKRRAASLRRLNSLFLHSWFACKIPSSRSYILVAFILTAGMPAGSISASLEVSFLAAILTGLVHGEIRASIDMMYGLTTAVDTCEKTVF